MLRDGYLGFKLEKKHGKDFQEEIVDTETWSHETIFQTRNICEFCIIETKSMSIRGAREKSGEVNDTWISDVQLD